MQISHPIFKTFLAIIFVLPLTISVITTSAAVKARSVTDELSLEEIDMLDLDKSMSQTANPTILRVYANLLQGSTNHLRAFVTNWERQSGEIYALEYMAPADYDASMVATSGHKGGSCGMRSK